MNKNQINATTVLNRMVRMAADDEDYADIFCDTLEGILNDIQSQDGFGTEGQCDPRGDQRAHEWSMWDVQESFDD